MKMKKSFLALTLAVVMLMSLIVFVACNNGNELVNTSGNYKEIKLDELQKELENYNTDTLTSLEMLVTITMTSGEGKDAKTATIKVSAICAVDKDQNVTMSGSLNGTSTGEEAVNATYYADKDFVYVAFKDQKVKAPISGGSGFLPDVSETPDVEILIASLATATKLETSKSGKTLKIKATMGEGETAAITYIVFVNGHFQGATMTQTDDRGEFGKTKTVMEFAVTTKAPVKPADLNNYKEGEMPF